MHRRDFLKKAGVGLLLGLSACNKPGRLSVKSKQNDGTKPNIIFILADDLGYSDVSCYGQRKFSTPNIDTLATEGLRFTQHYAGSTVCSPSRSCLMTGQHCGHTPIRGNYQLWPEGQLPLPQGTVTVGHKLQEAGYTTACIGKWGLGGPGSSGEPNEQGFDHWFGFLCQLNAHRYYPNYLWRNDKKVSLGQNDKDQAVYCHDLFTDEAMDFIRSKSDEPFFLYLAYTIPHVDLSVPEDSLRQYEGTYPETPYPGNGHYVPQKSPRAAYAAMISRMDGDVGKISALLKELDIDDQTLVIFASDNGPTRDGGVDPEFFDSNGPLRGFKIDLYEGGIRIPFIARWPGKIAPGSVTDHVSAFWDFMPTACELADICPPPQTDGISYVPTLLGKPEEQGDHEYLYWEYSQFDWGKPKDAKQICPVKNQAIRVGHFKAIRKDINKNLNSPIELYDLSKDIQEHNDIASEHPEIIEIIKTYLSTARTHSDVWPLPTIAT